MTVADWLLFKTELVRATALSRDALHIYLGLFAHVAAALLLRRNLGDWLPWLVVLALAVGNEFADLVAEQAHTLVRTAQGSLTVRDVDPEGLDAALRAVPVKLSTMGRGLDEDHSAFLYSAAAGRYAARLLES